MRKHLLIHVYENIYPIRSGVHSRIWQVIKSAQSLGCEVSIISSAGRYPKRMDWNYLSKKALNDAGVKLFLTRFSVLGIDFWLSSLEYIYRKRIGNSILPRPGGLYFKRPQLERLWKKAIKETGCTHSIVNYCNWSRLVCLSKRCGVISGIEMIDSLRDQYIETSMALGRGNPSESSVFDFQSSEDSALASADIILAINPIEASALTQRCPIPVLYIPYCTEPRWCELYNDRPIDILIVGSATVHNINGLHDFLSGSLPGLRKMHPTIKIKVCGSLSDSVDDSYKIEKAGFVENLTAEYNIAKIVLLVTKSGAGIKIKTIEALAHGACIVAHAHCMKGIECSAGAVVVVDDLRKCENELISIVNDPSRQNQMREGVRKTFIEQYCLKRGIEAFRKFIQME